jgi:hypothetical protein
MDRMSYMILIENDAKIFPGSIGNTVIGNYSTLEKARADKSFYQSLHKGKKNVFIGKGTHTKYEIVE